MRRLMVLAGLLLLLGGCSMLRSLPATEKHVVAFEVETVRPSTYARIKANYSLEPLADKKGSKWGDSWQQEITVHYPDVQRLTLLGEIKVDEDPVLPPPEASIELRCRITVDGVVVAESIGYTVSCSHTMTAGAQVRSTSSF